MTPSDAQPIDVTCVLDDVNKNLKLDKGDKLACTEGDSNALGAALAGEPIDVEVLATAGGSGETVGEAVWTPK